MITSLRPGHLLHFRRSAKLRAQSRAQFFNRRLVRKFHVDQRAASEINPIAEGRP